MNFSKNSFSQGKKVIGMIRNVLPSSAQILCLTLTGSRAWGGVRDSSDFDIVGIYAANNYWDSVQLCRNGFDIDLYQFKDPLLYKRFYFFLDLSNYFYVNPKFEIAKFLKFGASATVKSYQREIMIRMQTFKMSHLKKDALHAYESLLASIYFLQKHKLTLNIFKITKDLNLPELKKLGVYQKEIFEEGMQKLNTKGIEKELEMLFKIYLRLISNTLNNLDTVKIQKWLKIEKQKFY